MVRWCAPWGTSQQSLVPACEGRGNNHLIRWKLAVVLGKDKSWGAPPIVSAKQAVMFQAPLVEHNQIQNKLNCSEPRRGGLK
jgi:hypothetical protein